MSKKRRNFSAQFKLETVLDGLRREKMVAQICRERDITESLYYKWRDAFFERATDIFADQRGPQRDEQAKRIAELERLAGKQALELEILKKGSSLLVNLPRFSGGKLKRQGTLN